MIKLRLEKEIDLFALKQRSTLRNGARGIRVSGTSIPYGLIAFEDAWFQEGDVINLEHSYKDLTLLLHKRTGNMLHKRTENTVFLFKIINGHPGLVPEKGDLFYKI